MIDRVYPAPPSWQPMRLRPMVEADVPRVAGMLRQDADSGHYASSGKDMDDFVATILRHGVMPGPGGHEYRVNAIAGIEWDALVGYAFVRTPVRDPRLAELWMFGVDPSLRYMRLGKRMLDQVMAGPACAGKGVMARCHPASQAMRTMLRHRRFALLATGVSGVSLLASGLPAALIESLGL